MILFLELRKEKAGMDAERSFLALLYSSIETSHS